MKKLTDHFNGLTEAESERLAILSEECAEVIKAVAKIQRHGFESCNPLAQAASEIPETNRVALEREIGDVICAIRKLRHAGDLSESEIDRYADAKASKIKRWLHHSA